MRFRRGRRRVSYGRARRVFGRRGSAGRRRRGFGGRSLKIGYRM